MKKKRDWKLLAALVAVAIILPIWAGNRDQHQPDQAPQPRNSYPTQTVPPTPGAGEEKADTRAGQPSDLPDSTQPVSPVPKPGTGDQNSQNAKSGQTGQPEQNGPAALDVLAGLSVKGRAPKTGYKREIVFGQRWKDMDQNHCNTRNDILARDLTEVRKRADNCKVLSGTLNDPYTGKTLTFAASRSEEIQIDHVVALSNAWQTGAQQISQEQREHLANDPLNLLAVSGAANQQKGAGDAATWLPKNKGYRCAYVARQIAVKAKYSLWVTPPEKAAMERILGQCPQQAIPTN